VRLSERLSPKEGEKAMGNLIIFAVLGLLAGAASRLFYPGRQPRQVVSCLLLGVLGAVAGGMISWSVWPPEDGQFQSGNIAVSMIGAAVVLVVGAIVLYGRRLAGAGSKSS
jgi:uncharacterized membrane protein YeaQ/YmgE (transglycosylase-associated protein family)